MKDGLDTKPIVAIRNFLFLVLVFSISYTSTPLFTGNQNTHFIRGLARAGLGNLHEDWFANTVDPFPVFSLIVSVTYQYLHEYVYYLYFIFLLGIYIYSLIGIASILFDIQSSRSKYMAYLACLIIIHAEVFRNLTLKLTGVPIWRYLQSGVAAQHILSGNFERGTFGALLVFSVYLFLRGRPYLAVFFFSLAGVCNPSYLFSAAVLTAIYMLMLIWRKRSWKKAFLVGLFALGLVLPLIVYIVINFNGTSPEMMRQSADILVNFRAPHHAVLGAWMGKSFYAQMLIVFVALILVRRTPLFPILLISSLVGLSLILAQILLGSLRLAMLMPWRIFALIVPLSTSMIAAWLVTGVFSEFRFEGPLRFRMVDVFSIVLIGFCVLGGIKIMKDNVEEQHAQDSVPMMTFVKDHTSPGEIYLIPVEIKLDTELEGFRLYAGAPIVVDYKSHPYDDRNLIEWYTRIQRVVRFYEDESGDRCDNLKELSKDYGVTHVVFEKRKLPVRCRMLEELYKDDHYGVYRVTAPLNIAS